MTKFSERAAEFVIAEFARRLRQRLSLPPETSLTDVVRQGLDDGDPVAEMMAEDSDLRRVVEGLTHASARNRAANKTLDAIKLLALADAQAERGRAPAAKSDTPLASADMVVPKARPRRRQGILKEAEQKGEARGVFAFRALFLIGPDEGPVRIGVSKQPVEQLRLANSYCLLSSHLGYEGYATSNAKALRVARAVVDYAATRGLRHPRKNDVIMVPMTTAIEVVSRVAAQLGIALLSREEKTGTVAEFEKSEWEREDVASGLGE